MAVTLSQDMWQLLFVGLDEIFRDQVALAPSSYAAVFQEDTTKKRLVEHIKLAGFGSVPQRNPNHGQIAYDKPISGARINYTQTGYGLAWALSEELIEDDLYNTTGADLTAAAARSCMSTIEQLHWNIFINGFTDTGPDGESLFDTAHPLFGGGTQANRPANGAALSATTIEAASAGFRRLVNERNQLIDMMPDTLIVPPELEYTAKALITNTMNPAATFNTENVYQGLVKNVIVVPYLTSTTAFFFVAMKALLKMYTYWKHRPKYTLGVEDFDTGSMKNKVTFRLSLGYTDYIGLWGNPGT